MSELVQAQPVCPNCDTPLKPNAAYCGNCGLRGPGSAQFQQPAFGAAATFVTVQRTDIQKGTARSFTIASLLIVITVIGVLLGITVQAPGLGILLSLFAVPPWIRTALVVRKQRALGIEPTASDRVALFLGSMFVTWVIVFTLVVSCCLTFCAVCIGVMSTSGGGRGDESVLWLFIWSSVLAVAGTILFLFSFWIRARWRRHTDLNRLKK